MNYLLLVLYGFVIAVVFAGVTFRPSRERLGLFLAYCLLYAIVAANVAVALLAMDWLCRQFGI